MSDIFFQKGSSFAETFYSLLVERRYCRASVSQKWYYVEWKRSYLDRWLNIEDLLERTAVSIRHLKRTFFLISLLKREFSWPDYQTKLQEHFSACFFVYMSFYDDKSYFQIIWQSSALEPSCVILTWLNKAPKDNIFFYYSSEEKFWSVPESNVALFYLAKV